MQCNKWKNFISDSLDDRLEPAEQRSLQQHLRQCPECCRYHREMEKTVVALRRLPRFSVPEGFAGAVTRNAKKRWQPGSFYIIRWSLRLAALFLIALTVVPLLLIGMRKFSWQSKVAEKNMDAPAALQKKLPMSKSRVVESKSAPPIVEGVDDEEKSKRQKDAANAIQHKKETVARRNKSEKKRNFQREITRPQPMTSAKLDKQAMPRKGLPPQTANLQPTVSLAKMGDQAMPSEKLLPETKRLQEKSPPAKLGNQEKSSKELFSKRDCPQPASPPSNSCCQTRLPKVSPESVPFAPEMPKTEFDAVPSKKQSLDKCKTQAVANAGRDGQYQLSTDQQQWLATLHSQQRPKVFCFTMGYHHDRPGADCQVKYVEKKSRNDNQEMSKQKTPQSFCRIMIYSDNSGEDIAKLIPLLGNDYRQQLIHWQNRSLAAMIWQRQLSASQIHRLLAHLARNYRFVPVAGSLNAVKSLPGAEIVTLVILVVEKR